MNLFFSLKVLSQHGQDIIIKRIVTYNNIVMLSCRRIRDGRVRGHQLKVVGGHRVVQLLKGGRRLFRRHGNALQQIVQRGAVRRKINGLVGAEAGELFFDVQKCLNITHYIFKGKSLHYLLRSQNYKPPRFQSTIQIFAF